jgi:hypothetical protein
VPPNDRLVRAADRENERVPVRTVERENECATRPPVNDGRAKDRVALREKEGAAWENEGRAKDGAAREIAGAEKCAPPPPPRKPPPPPP